jgi:hypothetical protein
MSSTDVSWMKGGPGPQRVEAVQVDRLEPSRGSEKWARPKVTLTLTAR